ncbi:MAG: NYN domain-containing protein, partial [Acidimicrobiales bacterium]
MSAGRAAHQRVVVDGSNFATEGRTLPSLVQLDEAVRAYMEESPDAEVIVVVDASFEHRVAASERRRFKESELAGEVVTPPAGAVGRGDAFILKIADRIGAVVLSNDSFQEFHEQYPWLFDVGRLIGGKPVPGVGWVFTPRLPVRNPKMARVAKKLAVTLSGGERPTIGTTLTPVAPRATRSRRATPVEATPVEATPVEVAVVEVPVGATKRPSRATKKAAPAAAVAPVLKAPARATRRRRATPVEATPVEATPVEVAVV